MTQELTPSLSEPAAGLPASARTGWWRDAVIYQVYVRSFADGDGDGVGDLRGARERLPHLARLGVDAVWLTPFYASPQADGGYDVADYRVVDPLFGDLDDARELIRTAHGLGLRVITDIVPNHTSDRHAWFREALREGPGSAARARYLFRPGRGRDGELPPNDWESVFGGPAWTRTANPDGTPGEWYLHLFAPEQPDLNWDEPEVRREFDAILRFWLDLGVDGFRIDVAHGMVKAPGLPDIGHGRQAELIGNQVLPFFDQDGVHEIHRHWRRLLDSYGGDRIGVAEAWAPSSERLALYVRPEELHQAFNFQFLKSPWDPGALRAVVDESLAATGSVGAPTTWVLSNHDVVRHPTRYADGDPERGLRRARAAALLMLALPGSAYVYQGEELGLPEVTDLPDAVRQDPSFFRADGQDGFRDGCRVPIPWSGSEPPYGFGPEPGGPSWLPQPPQWKELSVAEQEGTPGSTLELYRSAIALRREHPALGAGEDVEWLDAPEGVLAFRRTAAGPAQGADGHAEGAEGAAGAAGGAAGAAGPAAGAAGLAAQGAADRADGAPAAVVVTLNTLGRAVELPAPGRLLLSSAPPAAPAPRSGGRVRIPADSCAWWAI